MIVVSILVLVLAATVIADCVAASYQRTAYDRDVAARVLEAARPGKAPVAGKKRAGTTITRAAA